MLISTLLVLWHIESIETVKVKPCDEDEDARNEYEESSEIDRVTAPIMVANSDRDSCTCHAIGRAVLYCIVVGTWI